MLGKIIFMRSRHNTRHKVGSVGGAKGEGEGPKQSDGPWVWLCNMAVVMAMSQLSCRPVPPGLEGGLLGPGLD